MSYSIGPVRGATKDAALIALAEKFDTEVLPTQPDHAHDRDAHLANVERELALLPEATPEQEFVITMNGWLSWRNLPEGGKQYTGGGFGCTASLVRSTAPAPAPAPAPTTTSTVEAPTLSMVGTPAA